jgi:hypothetical protein
VRRRIGATAPEAGHAGLPGRGCGCGAARWKRARIAAATWRGEEIIVRCLPGTMTGRGAPILAATWAGVPRLYCGSSAPNTTLLA